MLIVVDNVTLLHRKCFHLEFVVLFFFQRMIDVDNKIYRHNFSCNMFYKVVIFIYCLQIMSKIFYLIIAKLPAILALMKQIIDPEIKARTATDVTVLRFSGDKAPRFPIIIPIELKFAKPQMANVVIAALRC